MCKVPNKNVGISKVLPIYKVLHVVDTGHMVGTGDMLAGPPWRRGTTLRFSLPRRSRHLASKVCGELVLTNNRMRSSLAKLCVCGHSHPSETVSQQFMHFLFCNL